MTKSEAENKNASFFVKKSIKSASLFIGCVAIMILVGGGVLEYFVNKELLPWPGLLNIISVFLITLGSIMLTSAVSTFLLDKSGLIELLKIQLKDIMISDEYIKTLKREKLANIRQKINNELYCSGVASNENSLLNTVNRSIDPLLEKYYFEYYDLEVTCKIENEIIKKVITRTMKLKPMDKTGTIMIKLKELFSNGFIFDEEEHAPPVELLELEVDDADLMDKIILKKVVNRGCSYTEEYFLAPVSGFEDHLLIPPRGTEVRIVIQTIVPIRDPFFYHKLPVACEKYSARFNYNHDECDVLYGTFGFLDSVIEGKCKTKSDPITIKFNEWILPGDGVAFTIIPK